MLFKNHLKQTPINNNYQNISYRYNSSATPLTPVDFEKLLDLASTSVTDNTRTVAKLDVYINISYASLVDQSNTSSLTLNTICSSIQTFFDSKKFDSNYRLDLNLYFLRDGTNKSFAIQKEHLKEYEEALDSYNSCVTSLSNIFKLEGNNTKAKPINTVETYPVLKSRSFVLNKRIQLLTSFFVTFKQQMSDTAPVDINKEDYTIIANFCKLYFQHRKCDITVIPKYIDSNIKKTWVPTESDLFINTTFHLLNDAITALKEKPTRVKKTKEPITETNDN